MIARLAGWKAAEDVVSYVAPVGQNQEYAERARKVISQYLPS
jgi:hypothetical protein